MGIFYTSRMSLLYRRHHTIMASSGASRLFSDILLVLFELDLAVLQSDYSEAQQVPFSI